MIEYKLVSEEDPGKLMERVSKMLNDGWEVSGSLILSINGTNHLFIQPMINYNKQ